MPMLMPMQTLMLTLTLMQTPTLKPNQKQMQTHNHQLLQTLMQTHILKLKQTLFPELFTQLLNRHRPTSKTQSLSQSFMEAKQLPLLQNLSLCNLTGLWTATSMSISMEESGEHSPRLIRSRKLKWTILALPKNLRNRKEIPTMMEFERSTWLFMTITLFTWWKMLEILTTSTRLMTMPTKYLHPPRQDLLTSLIKMNSLETMFLYLKTALQMFQNQNLEMCPITTTMPTSPSRNRQSLLKELNWSLILTCFRTSSQG